MSKYNPLSARLAGHAGPEWRASFAELEEVLGSPLPKAARAGEAWWRADAKGPQVTAWAGWETVDVDPAAGLVTFRKVSPSAPEPPPTGPIALAPGEEPAILTRLEATPKLSGALIAGGLMLAAGLGVFALRGVMKKKA